MKVQIEIAAPRTDLWQAIDTPEPLASLGFEGSPAQQADAAAADYAYTQDQEGAEPGLKVRAVLLDEHGAAVTVSDVHAVPDDQAAGRTGRPQVGGVISTAIGAERLAQVDEQAARYNISRAEAIRRLLDIALALDA